MKTTVLPVPLLIACLFGCAGPSDNEPTEVLMEPLQVGTKTPDYEVISPSELKLSPGVKVEVIKDSKGEEKGFVLRRANGSLGGFMACECSGATQGSCTTENDNPDHASCAGGCRDSEGNPVGCQLVGPIIGPPRDPYLIRVVRRN